MPSNQPNKHAVRLSADDIRWVAGVLEDCAATWDKRDPDSLADIKRARAVADAIVTFDQAVDAYTVVGNDIPWPVFVFLDEVSAERKARTLEKCSPTSEKFNVERSKIY
jgi:hypothetical protein